MAYEDPSVYSIQSASLLASTSCMASGGIESPNPTPVITDNARLISLNSSSVACVSETSSGLEPNPCKLCSVLTVKMPREYEVNVTLAGDEELYRVAISDASIMCDCATGNQTARIVCSQIQIKLTSNNACLGEDRSKRMKDTYCSKSVKSPSFVEALAEAVIDELFTAALQELSTIANVAITAADVYQRFQDSGWQSADLEDGSVDAATIEMRMFEYAEFVSQVEESNWFDIYVENGQSCYFTVDYLVHSNNSSFFTHITKKYKLSGGNLYEILS